MAKTQKLNRVVIAGKRYLFTDKELNRAWLRAVKRSGLE